MLIVENTIGFVATRPPAVVFFASVIAFTTAAFAVAFYAKESPLRDHNVKVDWNGVLGNLASLELCAEIRNSPRRKPGTVARSVSFLPPQGFAKDGTSTSKTSSPSSPAVHMPVSVSVPKLKLGTSVITLPKTTTKLKGIVSPQDLGLSDAKESDGNFTVSLDFGKGAVFTNCTLSSFCIPSIPPCVTFEGPTHFLPNIHLPKTCSLREVESEEVITWNVIKESEDFSCPGVTLSLEYWPDAALTPTLSPEDSTLVSVHMMYTAYFLLAMAISCFVVAVFKGRTRKNAHLLSDKATLVI